MNTTKGTLIVIAGPTGVGKTDVAIELSRRLGRIPIISADSRQVFRGMAIGTAQPSAEQLEAAPHYFIADRDIDADYTCGCFEKEALVLLDELFRDYSHVIAVGGSGLYIDALCGGFDELPLADKALRQQLESRLKDHGIGDLLEELRRRDPAYYDRVDRHNPARVMRALEVCMVSGRPYSEQRSGKKHGRDFNIIKIGIGMPREELYERIDRRVDSMIAAGLEEEARALYPHRHLNALRTVGYREFFDYFSGCTAGDAAYGGMEGNTSSGVTGGKASTMTNGAGSTTGNTVSGISYSLSNGAPANIPGCASGNISGMVKGVAVAPANGTAVNHATDATIDGTSHEEAIIIRFDIFDSGIAAGVIGSADSTDSKTDSISREKAIELIKRNTRHYAKRQMTWFNRDPEMRWFEKKDIDSIENYIKKFAE